uniref:T-cell receptor alpha/delta variable 1 n=1 Tax=Pygocentrus nattereri TaxID=42514 RepID=A0A3B4E0C3_PYGNA
MKFETKMCKYYHNFVGESVDSIRPNETSMFVSEGSRTTLSCTYDGSPNSLHWYQQKPGSRPEFLLLIHVSTRRVTEAKIADPRLSITLPKDQNEVDLIISSAAVSDSALYYSTLYKNISNETQGKYRIIESKCTKFTSAFGTVGKMLKRKIVTVIFFYYYLIIFVINSF